jgi:outer membrane protein
MRTRMRSRCVPVVAACLVATAALRATAAAEEPKRLDLSSLERGTSPFPLFWRPYRQRPLPPVDLRNGSRLAERLSGGRLALSLREYLQLVVENNLDLAAARYGVAIAQLDVLRASAGQAARGTTDTPLPASLFAGAIGAGVSTTAPLSSGGTGGAAISTQGKLFTLGPRGVFDPTVSANFSYDRVVSPLNTTRVAGAASVTVPSTVLQTRFQQEWPEGTSYAVSFNLQRQTSTQSGLLFNPALTSFFAVQVFQPLLNGFGFALNRRFVTVAKNEKEMAVQSFRTTLNSTLAAAADAYWDLIALRENVRVAQQVVAAAQQRYDDTRQQVELDTMTPLDLLAAESDLASSRVALLRAEDRLQQQEVFVKTLISKTSDAALDAAVIEPTDSLPASADVDVPSLGNSIEMALANRAAIRQAELGLENQHIAQEFTRKNLLPTLSAYAAFDAYGLSPGAGRAVRQLWRSNFPEYSVGFTLSVPVFNRAAQADDLRARLEGQNAEAALQRTKNQIRLQVESASVTLSRARAQIEAAERAVAASQRAFEGAEVRLRAGTGTAYQVTLAERDLRAAQSADIQTRVNYAKALIAQELAVSTLLQRNGIDFDQALAGALFSSPVR